MTVTIEIIINIFLKLDPLAELIQQLVSWGWGRMSSDSKAWLVILSPLSL